MREQKTYTTICINSQRNVTDKVPGKILLVRPLSGKQSNRFKETNGFFTNEIVSVIYKNSLLIISN